MKTFATFFKESVNISDEIGFVGKYSNYMKEIERFASPIGLYNKHVIKLIQNSALENEKNNKFGVVRGPKVEIYFAPSQPLDIKTRKQTGHSNISVYEKHIDSKNDMAYNIENTGIEFIEQLWC